MSARDEILNEVVSTIPEKVDTPWLEYDVYVKLLGGDQVVAMEGRLTAVSVTAAASCDKDGNELFTTEDAERLGESSFRTLRAIFHAGCKFNGIELSATEEEAAKATEEAVKNSEKTDGSCSTSG